MPREINAAGYRLIKEFEAGPEGNSKPALTPYRCPAGKLTIGWGHTKNVTPGQRITPAEAERLLDEDLDWAEACVDTLAPAANDNEFAAMVALTFNIGEAGFAGSTVRRLFNKGDKAGAAAAFAMWRKMTDPNTGKLVDSPGLIRRRGVEAALFLEPAPARELVPVGGSMRPVEVTMLPPQEPAMPQAVAPEKPAVASKTVVAGGITVAAGLGSVADQLDTLRPVIDSFASTGASIQNVMRLGAVGLSVVAVIAAGFMLWRYIAKRRRGEVLST